jgi:uncharacterized protein with PIN domain
MAKPTQETIDKFNERLAIRAKRNSERERIGTHKRRCQKCGLRIRGPQHSEGMNHLQRSK